MFGVVAFDGRIGRRATRCLSASARYHLREVALAGLGCAVVGVFVAAQVRFGRFIETGPAEYRKAPNAGISLAAIAIFSYASNLELPERLHRRRTTGRRTQSAGAGVLRPGECDEAVGVSVYGGIKTPEPCLEALENRPRPASLPRSGAYGFLASRSI